MSSPKQKNSIPKLNSLTHSLKVSLSDGKLAGRLIGYGPHDNGRPVLVPLHQLCHHLQVVGQRLVGKVIRAASGQRER